MGIGSYPCVRIGVAATRGFLDKGWQGSTMGSCIEATGWGLGLSSDGLGPVLEASVVPVYCNDG
jgi:hypothetical protein